MSSVTVEPTVLAPSAEPPDRPAADLSISAGEDLAVFHHTLARACRAQAPLGGPLRDLARDLTDRRLRDLAAGLAADLESGTPLAEAYRQRAHGVTPPTYAALIEAGMACGDIAGVLEDLGGDARARSAARARVRRALARPLASVATVFAVGVLALLWVGTDLDGLDAPLGLSPTPAAPSVLRHVLQWAAPGLAGIILLATAVLTLWGRPLDGAVGPRSWRLRLPLWGSLRLLAAKATFARTLGLLLRRSMPLPQALELTAAATDDPLLRQQVAAMARTAAEGADLRESLAPGSMLPASMLWFVEGNADDPARGLDDIARLYEQRLDREVDRACLWLAPMIELLLGIVVLLFALRLLAPSYESVRTIMGWW